MVKRRYRKTYQPPNRQYVWHYENATCQAFCRDGNPLFQTGIPDRNTTTNISDVTCPKCLQKLAEMGIKKEVSA